MNEELKIEELLDLAKDAARTAAKELSHSLNHEYYEHEYHEELKKELKAKVDLVLEEMILPTLLETGIPVLSEESGYIGNNKDTSYKFILDPLDGTYNFIRGSGPSAISIGLVKNDSPSDLEFVFGVIYDLEKDRLIWGGKRFGSYCNNTKILVSDINLLSETVLFSGFPVRFDFDENNQHIWDLYHNVAKVRMIGSAAMSLVNVAMGTADAYFEENIMLWDVAAGLAIVEGSGGDNHILSHGDLFIEGKDPVTLISANSNLTSIIRRDHMTPDNRGKKNDE